MRAWTIDIVVWLGLSLLLAGVAVASFQLTRPPTIDEIIQRQKADFIGTCRADPGVQSMPGEMREAHCTCMAQELNSFGGISQGDASRCRRSAARRMSGSNQLAAAFGQNYPAACQRIEEALSGNGDGSSAFCRCMAGQVEGDPTRAAMYAFAGGEGQSKAFDSDLDSCKWALVFGRAWATKAEGSRLTAVSYIPAVMQVTELAFVCDNGELSFETRDGLSLLRNQPVAFIDAATGENRRELEGVQVGPRAYQLLHRLAALSGDGAIGFQTDGQQISWTLEGFEAASNAVLAACPESREPTVAVASSGLADEWENFESTTAMLKQRSGRNWSGSLRCEDSPAYMEITSPLVDAIIAKYPDPAGNWQAAGVPMHVGGTQPTAFDQAVNCDDGLEGGAGLSCFLGLTRQDFDRIAALEPLEMTLDGQELTAVAFASSAAVQEAGQACKRAFDVAGN